MLHDLAWRVGGLRQSCARARDVFLGSVPRNREQAQHVAARPFTELDRIVQDRLRVGDAASADENLGIARAVDDAAHPVDRLFKIDRRFDEAVVAEMRSGEGSPCRDVGGCRYALALDLRRGEN